ncbi:MAG: DoxX family protein [Terracidiphilus sp.]
MAQTAPGTQAGMMERPANETKTASNGLIWTGRVLSILTVLFMLFDAFGKFAKQAQVLDACARLGIPASQISGIGVLLLVSTIIYAIPRSAVLGAVLLTGYLGGAVAIQMRAGSPTFETVFPVILGVVLWAGVYLRECGLRRVFPVKR